MFESATFEHRLDKAAFKALEPSLREDLLNAQFALIEAKRRSLIVLIHGPDGAGKGAVLNRLYSWLDVRKVQTLTFEMPCAEEDRPPMWKYWRELPPFGQIGVMLGSWYHAPLCKRALGTMGRADFMASLDEMERFESMLHAEGVSLLKIWLYLDGDEARRRLKALSKGDYQRPIVREWAEVEGAAARKRLHLASEEAARATSTEIAPWHVVPAADTEYCDAMVGSLLLEKLRAMAAEPEPAPLPLPPNPTHVPSLLPPFSILSTLDMSRSLQEAEYDRDLAQAQSRITRLTNAPAFARSGLVIAFEGSDAAGKSSTIMRLRRALDPRRFRVHPIAAPTDEERARPYLWRFWRHIPAHGRTAIFDRSWYGRVLVERVEGLCGPDDWGRAYGEINDFEAQLTRAGYVVVKFWLAISQEEQARRFEEREKIAYKRFKLTPEDWRNREKWPLYEAAVTEMVDRTSTREAPWTLVEAEDKHFARVKVLKTVADRLEAALGG
ncbi:polyphosphate:AMP phosphotransferase [Xanthobacter sp. DSM 14520]|uniref:polyphosphate:AMP phosphotransferase n=1 Tax=Xanthobacter autotrophicus (strain ATCC BAA-1158 / Py2) TaxID=78245 RepID=UPI00372CA8D1